MATSQNLLITLFLAGDVMTGRGIDQVLPVPCNPVLYEPYVRDANEYVKLAEGRYGPIPRPFEPSSLWGFVLEELRRRAPDVRVVNLETAVTTSPNPWPGKGIHYRMNPRNIECLTAAGIDCCLLANNHVLDWGVFGLEETLSTLEQAKIQTAGAGRTLSAASRPVLLEIPQRGTVAIIACGSESSGIFREWSATETRPGFNVIDEQRPDSASNILESVRQLRSVRRTIVVSIHWGPNWGYAVPPEQRRLAHALIDAGADVVFGHSSHHVKAIEVYRSRLILDGVGDLITDYEGIGGYEEFRGNLGLMSFLKIDPLTGELAELRLVPTRMERFQLTKPSPDDVMWLAEVLNREGKDFGTFVTCENGSLNLQWPH